MNISLIHDRSLQGLEGLGLVQILSIIQHIDKSSQNSVIKVEKQSVMENHILEDIGQMGSPLLRLSQSNHYLH